MCEAANEGDTLFIVKRTNNNLLAIIVPAGSTIPNQLLWLFDLNEIPNSFNPLEVDRENSSELDFVARYILEELGLEVEEPEANKLDALIDPYITRANFPTTKIFSKLARDSLPEVSAVDNPDTALVEWLDREEQMFRRLERHIVSDRIKKGFCEDDDSTDVDGFLSFSLHVQNRRKSRAGLAL